LKRGRKIGKNKIEGTGSWVFEELVGGNRRCF
jgi:hypothetical protein